MKTTFLYAGQGSRCVGRGQDFYESEPAFRAVFDMLSPAQRTFTVEDTASLAHVTQALQQTVD